MKWEEYGSASSEQVHILVCYFQDLALKSSHLKYEYSMEEYFCVGSALWLSSASLSIIRIISLVYSGYP